MKPNQVNRNFKDSLFRMLFKDKEELLSLYNAINGSDYQNPELLETRTLDSAIYIGMKNDVSFLINDYLNLYEAQSTWNPNMPLRGLLYFAELYQGYIAENQLDIYSSVQLRIPNPRFVVFYNGMTRKEDVFHLPLSESFLHTDQSDNALECIATVYNINYGHNKELMKSCRKLYEYSYLVEEIRKQIALGKTLEAAADKAVDICIEQGILESFLRKHRAEVRMSLLYYYDEELHIKNEKNISYNEGVEEGMKEGMKEGIKESIRNLLSIRFEKMSEELIDKINNENDINSLKNWITVAASAESIDDFIHKIKNH